MKPLMVLPVWEGRVSGSLIAMATLDHSSSKALARWVPTLVGSCSHRLRDDGGCVRGKEGWETLKSRPPTSLSTDSTLLCHLCALPLLAKLG